MCPNILDFILGVRDSLVIRPLLRQMAADWCNVSFEPVLLKDFDWVDKARLDFYQRDFEALGFEPRGDFSPQPPAHGSIGFMRLMGHTSEPAFISLHVVKPALTAPQPLRCVIICPLSEGWVVAGTDREADAILSQLRLPRAVSLRDCDALPAHLWREVMDVSAQLMREKSLHPVGTSNVEDFEACTTQSNKERAALVLKQNPVLFAIRRRILMRAKPSRRELWAGEWTPDNLESFK